MRLSAAAGGTGDRAEDRAGQELHPKRSLHARCSTAAAPGGAPRASASSSRPASGSRASGASAPAPSVSDGRRCGAASGGGRRNELASRRSGARSAGAVPCEDVRRIDDEADDALEGEDCAPPLRVRDFAACGPKRGGRGEPRKVRRGPRGRPRPLQPGRRRHRHRTWVARMVVSACSRGTRSVFSPCTTKTSPGKSAGAWGVCSRVSRCS